MAEYVSIDSLRGMNLNGAEPLLMAIVERDGTTVWMARANMADKDLDRLTKSFFDWKAEYKQARRAGRTGDGRIIT